MKTCGKCELYSRALLRCVEGKVNPKTKKGTKEVITVMGPGAVCGYSKWKLQAIKEMTNES